MATIRVKATVSIERTKTFEVKVRVNDVKEWLRENYGTPSEHGMEWDDESILSEFLPEVYEDLDFDEEEGEVEDTLTDDWMISEIERVS